MTQKTLLRKALLADAEAISNIYLTSRKKFIAFAPLAHSDESIYQWIREMKKIVQMYYMNGDCRILIVYFKN